MDFKNKREGHKQMKDKLIEIIRSVPISNTYPEYVEALADKLIDSNVILLPCKVGEIVYVIEPLWYGIWGDYEHKCRKCKYFYEGGMGDNADCSLGKNCCYHIVEEETDLRKIADWITPSSFTKEVAWGKTVFLDRASAEAKVREMEGDNNE